MVEAEEHEFEAPDPVLVRRRWMPPHRVQWTQQAYEIMVANGEVRGTAIYDERYKARHRARKLMRYLIDLELVESWQISEHTYKRGSGWGWCVEYHGGS